MKQQIGRDAPSGAGTLALCAGGSWKVRERPELLPRVASGALGRGTAGAERVGLKVLASLTQVDTTGFCFS